MFKNYIYIYFFSVYISLYKKEVFNIGLYLNNVRSKQTVIFLYLFYSFIYNHKLQITAN